MSATCRGSMVLGTGCKTCYRCKDEKRRMEAIPHAGPRDWVEDFPHDNGQYMRVCITCKEKFIGYKHRHTCKPCSDKPTSYEDLDAAHRSLLAALMNNVDLKTAQRILRESLDNRDYWKEHMREVRRLESAQRTAGKVRPECAAALCGQVECQGAVRGHPCWINLADPFAGGMLNKEVLDKDK